MSSVPGRVLKATGAGLVKDSAQHITQNDVPLYLPCPCPYRFVFSFSSFLFFFIYCVSTVSRRLLNALC